VDIPTNDILQIEADKVPAATAPPAKPQTVNHHPIQLDEALSAASHRNNISPGLLRSVIRAESGFNPNARSVKGAQGLMQLMPATAARFGVRDAFDPAQNVDGGARYLRELLGRYNNNLTFALAAYNAGPDRVEKYHGVPPFPETVSYVTRVLHSLDQTQSESGAKPGIVARDFAGHARKSSAPNFESIREFQNAIVAGDRQSDTEAAQTGDAN
jgi:soluble lytic murein transglycosylase-like protein